MQTPQRPLITLLTDFGDTDGYVGAMKGAALSIAPDASIIDISHAIPPQAVESGAYVLRSVYRHFPSGCVHVAVVDPGVGTARSPIGIKAGAYYFIGPDNGVLSWAAELFAHIEVRRIAPAAGGLDGGSDGAAGISRTFHGRDVFAPAAARLAAGRPFEELGEPWPSWQRLDRAAHWDGSRMTGEVCHVDRFGNLIATIHESDLADRFGATWNTLRCMAGPHTATLQRTTYAEADRGQLLALLNSSGHVEIAVNQGSAAKVLGLGLGARVVIARE